MLGTAGEKKFQVSIGYRESYAHLLFDRSRVDKNLTKALAPKEWLDNMDLTATYNVTSRLSVTGTMPFVFNRISFLLPPKGVGVGTRFKNPVTGIGDVSLISRAWLLNPKKHSSFNISLGTGIKIPTGNFNPQYTYPDVFGHFQRKAELPPSIMAGDGGTGMLFEVVAYKSFKKSFLRGSSILVSGNYLSNPRVTNNTLSAISVLGLASSPLAANGTTNSVPDSYAVRTIYTMPVPGSSEIPALKRVKLQASYRWEGIRVHDLFGGNRGFRQPGYVMAVGPGATVRLPGALRFNVEVPITITQRIDASPQIPFGVPLRRFGLISPVSVICRLTSSF